MEKTMYGSDVAAMYLWGNGAVVSTCVQGGSSGGNQHTPSDRKCASLLLS